MTWQDRKKAVREKYFQNLTDGTAAATPTQPKTIGNALSEDVTEEDPSESIDESDIRSFATSVTDTGPSETLPDPLESSMPVRSMSSSSESSTVWMVSPLGFTENNLKQSIVEPNGSLVPGLSREAQLYLEALAIGRSEPIEEVVYQIAQFFVDAEDERAEGSLYDCLEFYTHNY